MKSLFVILFAIVAAGLLHARPVREPEVFFRPGDTLYIEVIDNVGHHTVGRNNRFRNIKQTVEEVLEEIDFPVEFKVVRWGSRRYPEDQPQLNLYMMRWGDNGMGQIEARFNASLKRGFDRDKLGVFYERGQGGPFFASDVDRVYNDALRKALYGLAPHLNARVIFSSEGSEEAGDAPESEAGAADER